MKYLGKGGICVLSEKTRLPPLEEGESHGIFYNSIRILSISVLMTSVSTVGSELIFKTCYRFVNAVVVKIIFLLLHNKYSFFGCT